MATSLGILWKYFFIITWFIWIHRNNTIFRNWSVQPAHTFNLAATIFEDKRYYNRVKYY